MRTESAVITQVTQNSILVEDDYGDTVSILKHFVVGEPRIGATVTLLHSHDRLRAFVEPEQKPARILSEPDESGIQLIGRHISEVLRAVG